MPKMLVHNLPFDVDVPIPYPTGGRLIHAPVGVPTEFPDAIADSLLEQETWTVAPSKAVKAEPKEQ